MKNTVLLLSMQPEYAKKIFNGEKTVELRRVRPKLIAGDRVLVYASCPQKALLGLFVVEEIIEESLEDLWQMVKNKAGIGKNKFYSYYQGKSVGFGICLRQPQRFSKPVKLELIRQHWAKFYPPQGYRYLKAGEVSIVESLAECQIGESYNFSEEIIS
ncbi:MAG: ASCH domain-containing protein [Hormoscilla sp. GM7CHS1pb]|nr:ASCH domain-containing protein [Hormoscilla sp. GM7CHS1pb]